MELNKEEVLYWSPSVSWKVTDGGELLIENILFKGEMINIFPKFYCVSVSGASFNQLLEQFSEIAENKLKKFLKKLIDSKILVSSIQNIDELFYPQKKLYKPYNKYDEMLKIDSEKLNAFVEKQLTRNKVYSEKKIKLLENNSVDELIKNRKSIRKFTSDRVIKYQEFSNLIGMLAQRKIGEKRKYYYPSAGGLYPIDCYIYVKEDRVENIKKGIYYYSALSNELVLVDEESCITKEVHYYTNQSIFETSAFSIYFIYDADVSMAKYDGMGYFYAMIDTGIIIQMLTLYGEKNHLGSCIIGDMDYRAIEHLFQLSINQKFLCCMEFGYKE